MKPYRYGKNKDIFGKHVILGKRDSINNRVRPYYVHKYNFGGGFGDIFYKVVMGLIAPTLGDPLVVLGNGRLVAEIKIQAKRVLDPNGNPTFRVFWSSFIEYKVKDAFKDPGDLHNEFPGELEWMDCTPYLIIGYFASLNTGYVPY